MEMTQLIRKLGSVDLKLIRRDRFLIFMFVFIIYIALVMRFALPPLTNYLDVRGVLPNDRTSQSLADFYPLLIGFLVVFQGALISGTLFGFALLDEKDNGTIKALLITPVPLERYVLYRAGLPAVLASFVVILMMLFINQALVPFWQLVIISIGAAFTAPICTLFYGTYAENKVQGFAYSKIVGTAGLFILGAWFVPEPLQWLFGLFPPYWITKGYWMALEGRSFWWVAIVIGVVTQSLLIWWLAKQFEKMAYR